MDSGVFVQRHVEASEEFNRHEHRCDGTRVIESLAGGLTLLRSELFGRIHGDVEERIGADSMYVPVSEVRAERATKREIEIYQVVVSGATVADHRYVSTNDNWYLQWLLRLRLGDASSDAGVAERLASYLSMAPEQARLAFTDVLAATFAESRQAPLVLFRLVPLAVRIATELAFGDHRAAVETRRQQAACLPVIMHCHECCGKILENGESCRVCGNPLWNYDWLRALD